MICQLTPFILHLRPAGLEVGVFWRTSDKNGKDVFNCDKVELIYSTSYDEERIKLVGFARCDYLGTYVFVPVEEGSDMGHAYYLCKVYGLGVKYVNGVPWVGAVTLLQ